MIAPDRNAPLTEADSPAPWGWFALVSYVEEPQRSLLDSLRATIPGGPRPPVHITLLPPRPLPFPVEQACARVEEITSDTLAFEAELSDVQSFSQTDFLYLDIAEGGNQIHEIHSKLNFGDLSHPEFYDFRPHLTLGGPVPRSGLRAAQESTARKWHDLQCPRRVRVDSLVCLWLDRAGSGKEWLKYRSFSLRPSEKVPLVLGPDTTGQICSTGLPPLESFGQQGS